MRALIAGPGMREAMRVLRLLPGLILKIFGQDQHRHAIIRFRDSHAAIHQMTQLRGRRRLLNKARHIAEDAIQIQFLLIGRAAGGRFRLACNRDNRHMIHLRVIQASQQMCGTRPAC